MARFRLVLSLIFLVILLPTIYLLYRSWEHLSAEATFGQKERSFLILQMLNQRIYDDLAIEEKRSYSEYRFIRAVPMIGGEGVTLSDLAHFPVHSHYSGIVGYFQMEPDGSVHTPVLPDGLLDKIPVQNRKEREDVRDSIKAVLEELKFQNGLSHRRVTAYPYVYTLAGDSLKDNGKDLSVNEVLAKGRPFQKRVETPSQKEAIVFDVESERAQVRHKTSHDSITPEPDAADGSFDVEIEPFQARFDHNYIIFFRNVWRSDQRFTQGFIVNLADYLNNKVYKELQFSPEEKTLRLDFRKTDTLLAAFGAPASSGEMLYFSPLQFPLQDMEFAVYRNQDARPPGGGVIILLGFVMVFVLAGGLYGVYKITATQMRVSAKRQDFISAVSHELKTPLTAIRMYAEMLQNHWVVKEEKRQHYYNMIASETERLTRLIQNVLNISNLERHRWPVHLQLTNPQRFLEEFITKYTPTIERAGFTLEALIDPCDTEVYMDIDATFQMLMNVLENAFKFAKGCEPKKIQIGLRVKQNAMWMFVRDFGPGSPNAEKDRVFQEFYRVENEMTRRTSGAGIGLSLVRKFSELQNIRVELLNVSPGLKVELHLPVRESF